MGDTYKNVERIFRSSRDEFDPDLMRLWRIICVYPNSTFRKLHRLCKSDILEDGEKVRSKKTLRKRLDSLISLDIIKEEPSKNWKRGDPKYYIPKYQELYAILFDFEKMVFKFDKRVYELRIEKKKGDLTPEDFNEELNKCSMRLLEFFIVIISTLVHERKYPENIRKCAFQETMRIYFPILEKVFENIDESGIKPKLNKTEFKKRILSDIFGQKEHMDFASHFF